MNITSIQELRELYGFPSGRAKLKVLHSLEKHSINFVEQAPFLVLSTYNRQGNLDASPRGGRPGFVKILNRNQLLIPDARGNNRLDSLTNIIETKAIGLLFFIPGVDETLRVNGKAQISILKNHLALFSDEKNKPKCCIVVTIEEVFLHCAKAFMRSQLWDPTSKIKRDTFPTMGKMLNDQIGMDIKPERHEDMIKRYKKDL
ncbi:MSMEG_1061 family FMN-dependent PPOX-type flavoprotein [Aestuariivivens sediminis]|uniref:MSMEG_1061 family FMN-dependent PPOX-type flavoprotein n=1 Tax=Aestuariivivens sediminis TaxID=2913557 RepID=UPI001F5A0D40|nr:MSMEG_1061 family FMN-dependent PPOX-type flavoprotein [Aestuariivivens sediminis]